MVPVSSCVSLEEGNRRLESAGNGDHGKKILKGCEEGCGAKDRRRSSTTAHTRNPATCEAEAVVSVCEFQASLFYMVKFQASLGYLVRSCLEQNKT